MSEQGKAKIDKDDLTHEQLEFVAEGACDGCKMAFWVFDNECWHDCESFQKELRECQEAGLEKT